MANMYTLNSGKVACAAAATAKVPITIATGANITATLTGLNISFDGNDASKTPALCELVTVTVAPSGGTASQTPKQVNGKTRTSQLTGCRINDTTDGSGTVTVLDAWLISPTSAFAYQWPLGREIELDASSYLEVRITSGTAGAAVNYDVTVYITE